MNREFYERRHDEELKAAANAACEASRLAHERLARAYDEAAGRLGKPVAIGSIQPSRADPTGDRHVEARTG